MKREEGLRIRIDQSGRKSRLKDLSLNRLSDVIFLLILLYRPGPDLSLHRSENNTLRSYVLKTCLD